ncbi:MAG: carbohydrate-binding domain-containing protein, partial [Bacillota bacterium]|nr:carbohydrate-binding domain-containing protein [Bacillota bacterium]
KTDAVYLAYKNEVHEDVPEELKELQNKVITIAEEGTYVLSGKGTDVQIAVAAEETDAVRLVLDGVDITCRTAAAIQVYSGADPGAEGEYGVTIVLAEGSENVVNGSHTKKLTEADIKHDGAISSNISLGFEGNGSLIVNGDNEGIEVKFGHLTFNGGNIEINSHDDPINGSEDGVAVVTINDGYIFSSVTSDPQYEGDGLDSNGYIKINGGTVINLGHPYSMDSGIDSDCGSYINGGIVIGAGNMYDPIEDASEQLYMLLQFAESTDDLLVVTDEKDVPVFAYDFPYSYTYIAFSTPELEEGIYHVYLGGEIEGTQKDGLYTEITAYSGGTKLHHGGTMQKAHGGMGRPEGMHRPEDKRGFAGEAPGEMPADFMETIEKEMEQRGEKMPEDFMERMERGEMPAPPEGGVGGPRGIQSSSDVITEDFHLTRGSKTFSNVSSVVNQVTFSDVTEQNWFYEAVTAAAAQGILKGESETIFAPKEAMTRGEVLEALYALAGKPAAGEAAFKDLSADASCYAAAAWAEKNGILKGIAENMLAAETIVTREELVQLLYQYLGDEAETEWKKTFADQDEIKAEEAFAWALDRKILSDRTETLRPGDAVTKAEAATMLMAAKR